jgi:hypothetical protein
MPEPCRRLPVRAFGSQGSTGGCKEKRMRPQAEAEAPKLQTGPEDPDRVGMEMPK